ncbi:hypothetical protein [Nonomuraea sp. NPDC003201]
MITNPSNAVVSAGQALLRWKFLHCYRDPLDAELLLTLSVMHMGDRLNGSIVRDISRRVAAGYGKAGYRVREQMWIHYTRKIDASDPLAVLQYRDAHGRHAFGCYMFHPAELEVQRIKRAYCRARALDDLDDAELPTMPLPTLTAAQVAQLVSTATKDDPSMTVIPTREEPPTAGLEG